MRLRGLVFESFVTFERAEVNLCDDGGVPLDVVLFVGQSGAGKSALLRGISGLLSEAVGAGEDLHEDDIHRTAESARCRVVFDDVVDSGNHASRVADDRADRSRVIITLEKELGKGASNQRFRAMPPDAFDRWRQAIEREAAPRAAFSIASGAGSSDDVNEASQDDATDPDGSLDPHVEWLFRTRGGPNWEVAVRALDRVLWPYRFDHMTAEGDLIFSSAAGMASSSELGHAFESVLVMALELLRLSTDRPNEELVYVIDDIDAHLHPRWQSRIIGDLRSAFPRVQLVATTHSPFVVASVEPYQVFRLETASPGSVGNVIRVSDKVQKGASVLQVMDLAFGTPDLPGPRWAVAPSLSVRREVLRAIADDLTRGSVVYALPDAVHVRDARDAFGEPVLSNADGGLGHLFFIDREPGTTWGHPCEYVFRNREGKLFRHRAIWPPNNLDRFIPIGRG